MKKKQVIAIVVIIVIIVAVATMIMVNKKSTESKTEFTENVATTNVKLDEIEFKNITKEFAEGITTLRADVYNNGKQAKDVNIKIVLKDESGKELTSMIQILENVEPERKKLLSTGIMGNYSGVTNIEMKEISQKEIEKYN